MKIKSILICGADGFLGSFLTERFIFEEFELHCLVRKTDILTKIKKHRNKVYLHSNRDISKLFQDHRIDCIINCAISYGKIETFVDVAATNILLPLQILHAAIENGTLLYINVDTFYTKKNSVYSNYYTYSLTKLQILEWLKHFSQKIRVVNMRLEHVYGPYDSEKKFIPSIIQSIFRRELQIDLTRCEQKRDFIYITDVVRAFSQVVKKIDNIGADYIEFEVGTGVSQSLRQIVELIKSSCVDSNTILNFGKIPYTLDEIMDSCANIGGLVDLGWHPVKSISDGLQETINFYIEKTFG